MVISVGESSAFSVLLREATPGARADPELGRRAGGDAWDWSVRRRSGGSAASSRRCCGRWRPCPRLIIPVELWKSLDQRQRGTLLVHELAHLRRGDHRVRIFELIVTAALLVEPGALVGRQALRDVEEQCCDAWVVWAFPEAAKSYAETLLETLDFLNQSELSEPLLASGFGKVHHLRRRLTMIMSGTTPDFSVCGEA